MCRTTQLVRDKRLSQDQQAIAGRALTKVPEITVFFWITKILTTAMGEATSDFMNAALGPAIAVPLMLIGLVVALKRQFKATGYHAWNYWLVVVMVAVFGTSCADALHVGFGIPYTVSSAFYLVVLAVVFTVWHRSQSTLSIHSIYTRRREQFYWATVLATFALGTAAGDMTATNWHLGYLSSGLLFVSWFAYIMTRPLGASFADWLDATTRKGGLALGTGPVAVGLAVVMVGFIAYLAVTQIDVKGDQQVASAETPRVQPMLDLDLD
jgi:uncharacterized membrane-anchored protein